MRGERDCRRRRRRGSLSASHRQGKRRSGALALAAVITPTRKTRPCRCGAGSSAGLRARPARRRGNPRPCPTARTRPAPAGSTANSGWRARKLLDLAVVLLRQHRAGDIGDPPARLDQRRGALQHRDLVLQPHFQRAGPHPPFGVGIAPPGAGAGARRVDQHEIGGAVNIGERVGRRPSACGRRQLCTPARDSRS